MSIQVKEISKIYGAQKALDNISFQIESGEIVGLLGPNGAGKSTMMKIITCFIPPTTGNVHVCGFSIYEDPLDIRKKIGYLPENNPLYLEMYVKEFLNFISKIHKINKIDKRVNEIVELTGLGIEQHKKIGALSRGFKQRVGLAQALIHDPEVLILDEPTSGLDPNQIVEIRNLIKTIGKQKTIILSTHIMQEVEAICSRAIIIDKGKIVADDTTLNLATLTDKDMVVVEFNNSISEDLIKQISGVLAVKNTHGNCFKITTASNIDVRSDLFQLAVKNNIEVLSLHKEEQRLEKVFQELTHK